MKEGPPPAPPPPAMPPLAMICAMAVPSQAIARGGALPWKIPEDLRFFKETTMGRAVVMGRATYDSVGRPLGGRFNVVLSRDPSFAAPCAVAASLDEALALARAHDPEPFVIGGSFVYAEAMPYATRLLVTEIARDVVGDRFFPPIPGDFAVTATRAGLDPSVRYVTYART